MMGLKVPKASKVHEASTGPQVRPAPREFRGCRVRKVHKAHKVHKARKVCRGHKVRLARAAPLVSPTLDSCRASFF